VLTESPTPRSTTPGTTLHDEEPDNDRMLPTPNTLDMARRLPNNELVIYPDAGHGGIVQFHEQFVEKALEFLAK
jgi:pimeloyl-ACP methyl ester carboxylesterase